MRLPNLAALRLADDDRGAVTDVWVRYRLPRNADERDEQGNDPLDLNGEHYDGISQERFRDGQWIWKTEDNQGRARYDPRSYWSWLDGNGHGKDPFSREPIPVEQLRALLEGPPEGADDEPGGRVRLAEPSEADAIFQRWQDRRRGEDEGAEPEPEPEPEHGAAPAIGQWPQWLQELMDASLWFNVQDLEEVVALPDDYPLRDLVHELQIDDDLAGQARDVEDHRRALFREAGQRVVPDNVRWHMPFIRSPDAANVLESEFGVRYSWEHGRTHEPQREFFQIAMPIYRASGFKRALDTWSVPNDDGSTVEAVLVPVILRALVGYTSQINIAELAAFARQRRPTGYGPRTDHANLEVYYDADAGWDHLSLLRITISADFMAWACPSDAELRARGGPAALPGGFNLTDEGYARPARWSLGSALSAPQLNRARARARAEARECWYTALSRMVRVARALPAFLHAGWRRDYDAHAHDPRSLGIYLARSRHPRSDNDFTRGRSNSQMVHTEPLWYGVGFPREPQEN